jgi:hypothetical protein
MSSGDATDRLRAPQETPGDPRSAPRIVVAAVRRRLPSTCGRAGTSHGGFRFPCDCPSLRIDCSSAAPTEERRQQMASSTPQLRLGQSGWRASEEYLLAIVAACNRATGPVLEIRLSGVSYGRRGGRACNLRHVADRQSCISLIGRLGCDAPWPSSRRRPYSLARIVAYADYDWYDVRPDELERGVQLVICDGPPGVCRGGRYGLLPVVQRTTRPRCSHPPRRRLAAGRARCARSLARGVWRAGGGYSGRRTSIRASRFHLRPARSNQAWSEQPAPRGYVLCSSSWLRLRRRASRNRSRRRRSRS